MTRRAARRTAARGLPRALHARQIFIAVAVASALIAAVAPATVAPMTARDHERRAVEALGASDYARAAGHLEAALAIRHGHPRLLYNLACSYALAGRTDDALVTLSRLADMGVDFGARGDGDLDALRADPRWPALAERFAAIARPTENGEVTLTLSRWDLVTEGIAHDPATGRLFIGSMRDGSILAVEPTGEITRFASCASQGRLACFGLRVDAARGLLWAAASAMDTVEGYTEADAGATAIIGFDLETGAERHVHRLPERHPAFGFNDLALAPNGDIYIGGGGVYHLPAGAEAPYEMALEGPGDPIDSANGIAVTPDGRRLYVAVYAVGIVVVDLASATYAWLAHDDGVTLQGVDGLYLHEGDLIAVQNGVPPWRVVRLDLDAHGRRVTGARLLERGRPIVVEPMTAAVAGDRLHVLGRGPRPETRPPHVSGAFARWLGETRMLTLPLEVR